MAPFTKRQADVFFPPDYADDFPVSMQARPHASLRATPSGSVAALPRFANDSGALLKCRHAIYYMSRFWHFEPVGACDR